jgi:hypothetical protein
MRCVEMSRDFFDCNPAPKQNATMDAFVGTMQGAPDKRIQRYAIPKFRLEQSIPDFPGARMLL